MATKIEWTRSEDGTPGETWNPLRGCSAVSSGCKNCYAMRMAHRFSGPGKAYDGLTRLTSAGPKWTGKIRLVPEKLEEPLHWKKPRRIFVNSMSDLFHDEVPDEFIVEVFVRMAIARQHTYQILTKRSERMQEVMSGMEEKFWASLESWDSADLQRRGVTRGVYYSFAWPLPNVHLYVSVEDQDSANERIPHLLQTPAAVRGVSMEPLLGGVDIGLQSATCDCCTDKRWPSRWVRLRSPVRSDFPELGNVLRAEAGTYLARSNQHGALSVATERGDLGIKPAEFECLPSLDHVIVGGESGPGARPCNIEWIRSIVRQCKAAGVPAFVKQLGAKPKGWCVNRLIPGSLEAEDGFCDSYESGEGGDCGDRCFMLQSRKGADMAEWPADLRVQEPADGGE